MSWDPQDPHSPGPPSPGCLCPGCCRTPILWDPHPPDAPSSGCPGTPTPGTPSPGTSISRTPLTPLKCPIPGASPPVAILGAPAEDPAPAVFSADKVPAGLDAIIIGSGIGGLAAAVLLAKAGRRVLVLEQHGKLGGCCHTFSEKGFEFDAGKRGHREGDARMGWEPAQDPKPSGGGPGDAAPTQGIGIAASSPARTQCFAGMSGGVS